MVDSVKFGPAKPVPFYIYPEAKERVQPKARGAGLPLPIPQSLSLASALAQNGPPFDADKVASLKAAIANGSYQINLGEVADGIIRFGLNG